MVYLLKEDGSSEEYKEQKIGKYFDVSEPRFQEDIRLYGEVVICDLLFKVLNRYRDLKGVSVNLNSLNRDRKKQEQLLRDGFRAAKVSPHEYFLAADVDTIDQADTLKSVPIMRQAAKDLGIKIRIGWQDYLKAGQSFLHVDVCAEYFGKGKVWNKNSHPVQWEAAGSEW
tara:strand:+ start:814 stop:1323 length:510 start_codon:yes stop_codon:yes gene_type:complete